MRKFVFLWSMAVLMMAMSSCGNKAEQLQQRIDSLQTALLERDNSYNQLHEFVTVISDGLDSIAIQENSLLTRNPESPTPNREEMKRGLSQLKETLKQQRERISKLERDLANGRGDAQKLRTVITALKQQLEAKSEQISELMQQLEQSKISVEQLTNRVTALTTQTEAQQDVIAEQTEVMKAQDQALNEGFIKIGSKKELKDAGLLSGGSLLKKSKLDLSKIDASLFQKVDIRQVTEIPIPSRDPKILTQVPTGSYTLQENGQSTTLLITDPAKFWSISNYLIIQTK